MVKIIVDISGEGDYTSVQEAVNAAPEHANEPVMIQIMNGVYEERIVIPENKPRLHFVGENRDKTILTYHYMSNQIGENGEKRRLAGSASTTVHAEDFSAENLTFTNSAGLGAGQAVALFVTGDKASFYNVAITGHQDTLYTLNESRQYYHQCYISGTVDFIFGSATAVFEDCEIYSIDRHTGYVTAASTAEELPYGYVFLNCKLTGDAAENTVYLGRPWRPYSQVAYLNCWMGQHIHPEGWHNWRDPDKEKTANYSEFKSAGPGANVDERVAWSKQLNTEQAEDLSVEKVLAGKDGWNPVRK